MEQPRDGGLMLVLKVRRGEVVTIGEAYVKVKFISEDWAELGIEAPAEWAIALTKPPIEAGHEPANALNSP